MNCEETQPLLSAYLDGQVDETQRRTVEAHLSTCAHCRADAAALRQTIASIGSLSSVEPPPGFSQRVMAQVREEARERPSFWRSLFFPLWAKVPLQAATVLLIGGLAVYLYQASKPVQPVQMEMKDAPTQRTPAAPPQSKAAELDAMQESKAERMPLSGVADRGAFTQPPSKVVAAKEKPAAVGGMMEKISPQPVQTAHYELILTPQKTLERMEVLAPKLQAAITRAGATSVRTQDDREGFKRNLLLEPETIWLAIPEDQYNRLKTELGALGTITSEIQSSPPPRADHSASLRIKLVILLPKQKENQVPAHLPVQPAR